MNAICALHMRIFNAFCVAYNVDYNEMRWRNFIPCTDNSNELRYAVEPNLFGLISNGVKDICICTF